MPSCAAQQPTAAFPSGLHDGGIADMIQDD